MARILTNGDKYPSVGGLDEELLLGQVQLQLQYESQQLRPLHNTPQQTGNRTNGEEEPQGFADLRQVVNEMGRRTEREEEEGELCCVIHLQVIPYEYIDWLADCTAVRRFVPARGQPRVMTSYRTTTMGQFTQVGKARGRPSCDNGERVLTAFGLGRKCRRRTREDEQQMSSS